MYPALCRCGMAQPEPMEYAISTGGVTTSTQPADVGSKRKVDEASDGCWYCPFDYEPSSSNYEPSSPTARPTTPSYSPTGPSYTPSTPTYTPTTPSWSPTSPPHSAYSSLRWVDEASRSNMSPEPSPKRCKVGQVTRIHKIPKLNAAFWKQFPYELWERIYGIAFPDTPTDYASNLVARRTCGMKIQIQLVDYYNAFHKQEKLEKDKKVVKQYIKNIDKIFTPQNLELYNSFQPYTYKSRGGKGSASDMSNTKMERRKARNLQLAKCDLNTLEDDIPIQRARVVELSEEHARLKNDLQDLINQSLHCLIKTRPYIKTSRWFGSQMCKWRKQAHKNAVDEFTKKQSEPNMLTPVFVNPVLQQWYNDNCDWKTGEVPVDFAGKMCLVTEFSRSRRCLGGD